MNGYYKNWYKHYQHVKEEKEQQMQRSYYSKLAPKAEEAEYMAKRTVAPGVYQQSASFSDHSAYEAVYPRHKRRKKSGSLLGLLLPVTAVFASFGFLWYQLDLGPTRALVNEAFIYMGIRQEMDPVVSHHTTFLAQHNEFAQRISEYVRGEGEVTFDDLLELYHSIRTGYEVVKQVSGEMYTEALRYWGYQMYSSEEMMQALQQNEKVEETYETFARDNAEFNALISLALGLE